MNKSDIRKRILKLRKKNYFENAQFNFESIIKVLKKEDIRKKLLVDISHIITKQI